MTARLVLAAADMVGESLVWDAPRGRLVWVDIIGRRVQALTLASGLHQIWRLAGRPTSIGLCEDGSAILGMERHICRWAWSGTPVALVEVEPDAPQNRLNEGVVGPDGAFWVGTMQNNIADDDSPKEMTIPSGRLFRYAPEGALHRVSNDVYGITNTLVWPTPDLLITADTLANTLYRYRIEDGGLTGRETLLVGFARGLPDGSCLDAEGFLWTARVAGGACLTRTDPDGRVERVIDLPCSWPTSCCFGGPDLATLYVTSARFTQSPAHLAAHPQEGGLFALEPGPRGLLPYRFGGRL